MVFALGTLIRLAKYRFVYSPRLVSISVVHDLDRPSEKATVWLMQYGQLIDQMVSYVPYGKSYILWSTYIVSVYAHVV